MSRIDELKTQIAQIDRLIASGALTGDDARDARQRLEKELLASVLDTKADGKGKGKAKGREAAQAAAAAPAPEPQARPARSLVAGLVVFVVLFGLAGYAWIGNREGLAVEPGNTAAPAAADGSHQMGPAQIESLAEKLAQRLKEKPDDAEGWAMLARSYSVLGRPADAAPAFKRVTELRPKDAQAWADYADALATANGRKLDGEPEALINKALALEPDNLKALALAGTVAFNKGDALGAAKLWERAVRQADPGSDMGKQLQGALDEARQRAGLPPLVVAPASAPAPEPATTPAAAPAQAPAVAATAASSVQGRVALAPALQAQAAPGDTVFIFARPAQGAKVPLAILRKQVKDLPLDFTLDDSLSMSPAARLSTAGQVIVGARISKSGNAMPQPGDLQGLSAPVAVGARGVQLLISEAVR
ncbi:MAG: tetratricopeptide repeat protein [Burkholderiales bacterium]|nr:tetratricopeptide repeat protein [Burkholderiales bacterium]